MNKREHFFPRPWFLLHYHMGNSHVQILNFDIICVIIIIQASSLSTFNKNPTEGKENDSYFTPFSDKYSKLFWFSHNETEKK